MGLQEISILYKSRWCFFDRWGAWAGGASALALQRLPTGAQRVPATQAADPQVSLQHHVTPSWRPMDRKGGRKTEEAIWRCIYIQDERDLCLTSGIKVDSDVLYLHMNFDHWPCDIKRTAANSHRICADPVRQCHIDLFYVDTVSSVRTITPDWCNKLPLRWIKPQSIKQGRVDRILSPEIDISLSWSAMFCHGEISFFMNSVVTLQQYDLNKLQIFIYFFSPPWDWFEFDATIFVTFTSEIFISTNNVQSTHPACGSPVSPVGVVDVDSGCF